MSDYERESLAAEAKLAAEKKQVENLSKRPGERKNGQCIMKKRPASEGRGWMGAASAAQGFAPLRRRLGE
jgi:hypothetical protein